MVASHYDVVILGAGFGGLGMGAELMRNHLTDFIIFEQGSALGGVWRDNVYPGAACDTEAHLYCYSYFPNLRVSKMYAEQEELLGYLERFSKHFDLDEKIKYNSKITSAIWSDAKGVWEITLGSGQRVTCKAFVPAWGQLNKPIIPETTGLENFQGVYFHSAEWPENVNLKNKKVVSIGTAASAVQYLPELAKEVEKLYVLQRSPNWILPRQQKTFTEEELDLFESQPETFFASRQALHDFRENGYSRTQQGTDEQQQGMEQALAHLSNQVSDKELREKLTPDYDFGCKRILRSDDYYPTLMKDNVELVTASIDYVTENGVVVTNGNFYEADAIVFGTGFASQNFHGSLQIVGEQEITLTEKWQEGAEAYLGLTVPSFPNMFLVYGPNTNLNHNSIIAMLEIQHNYIVNAIKAILDENIYLTVNNDIFIDFNKSVQSEMLSSAFSSDCSSWYKNSDGKVVNNWSSTVNDYEKVATFTLSDFIVKKSKVSV